MFVVAGNSPVVLDGDGRLTDSDDATVFPGIEPGVWWNVHERNVTPILGRAEHCHHSERHRTRWQPSATVSCSKTKPRVHCPSGSAAPMPRPIATTEQVLLWSRCIRTASRGRESARARICGLHVTDVATGRDVLLRGGIVPMFELGRAYGRFSPDGRYLALQVANRLSEPGNFVLVDLSTGAIVSRAEIAVRMPAPGFDRRDRSRSLRLHAG